MGMFEDRFRRKFERQGDLYRFLCENGATVTFSHAEVEELVEEWKLYWATSPFWIGWFVLGVIAPAALWLADYKGFGIVLAVSVNMMMAVMLIHGERLPDGAAATRPQIGGDRSRYTAAGYDQELARRRRRLGTPGHGLLWPAFAIAAPALLYLDGHPWWAGTTGALFLVLTATELIATYRAPGVAARRRERGEPEPEKPVPQPLWSLVWTPLYFTVIVWMTFSSPTTEFYYSRWLAIPVAVFGWWQVVARLRVPRAEQPA